MLETTRQMNPGSGADEFLSPTVSADRRRIAVPDDDAEALPPAHPRFAAHFTHQLYDPDDFRNVELPPFGSDEGSDEVHDWAERLEELQRNPTLRYMLGNSADAVISDLRAHAQVDADDILIGQGFTLLRFTGRIDLEGRRWLVETLSRQQARTGLDEYARLEEDLRSFPDPDAAAGPSQIPGPLRDPASWFTVRSGSGDRRLERKFRALEQALATDLVWLRWWANTSLDSVEFYPDLDSSKTYVKFHHPLGEVLYVHAGLKRLGKIISDRAKREVVTEKTPPSRSLLRLPDVPQLLDELILDVMKALATELSMPPPPTDLPSTT